MSFHVQKWPDISNGGSDIPSKKEANKKGGEKTMGGKIGRKKKEKEGRKKKRRSQQKKEGKGEGRKMGGEEDRMKNRNEKERKKSWDQVFKQKEGSEPSALVYIGILVTSTITGHDGSVVCALASQAKGRGSIPSCGTSFFFPQVFSFEPPSRKELNRPSINLVGFCLVMPRPPN